jgi:hypothetical protein
VAKRTDGIQAMGDAEQGGGREFRPDGPLQLRVRLDVDTASSLVLYYVSPNQINVPKKVTHQDNDSAIFDKGST